MRSAAAAAAARRSFTIGGGGVSKMSAAAARRRRRTALVCYLFCALSLNFYGVHDFYAPYCVLLFVDLWIKKLSHGCCR